MECENLNSKEKYYIKDKEVIIDYEDDNIPFNILKELQEQSMTTLDSFHIRKSLFLLDKRLTNKVNNMEYDMKKIATDTVKEVVNGKVDDLKKIAERTSVTVDQLVVAVDDVKKQIKHVESKTVYGWIKINYAKNSLKTIAILSIIIIFLFLFSLQLFHIKIADELWNLILKIIGVS
jgi:hypothetical protein